MNSEEPLAVFRFMRATIVMLDQTYPELLHNHWATYRRLKSNLEDMIDFLEQEKKI